MLLSHTVYVTKRTTENDFYHLSYIVVPLAVEDDVTIDMTTGLLSVRSIQESEASVGSFILITVRE